MGVVITQVAVEASTLSLITSFQVSST